MRKDIEKLCSLALDGNLLAVQALIDQLEAAEKEADSLRAKVEAMEKQEPVAFVTNFGQIEVSFLTEAPTVGKLYALPCAAQGGYTPMLTAAQYETVQLAATRPSRALEPTPSRIKGGAKQSVLAALVARGYAVRCYLPGHVEYALTDAGLALFLAKDAAEVASGACVEPLIIMPDLADSPDAGG